MAQYTAFCQNPNCEAEFTAVRKDTKYCCKNCRNARYRIRQREAKQTDKQMQLWVEPLENKIATLEAQNQRVQTTIDEYEQIK